MAGRHNRTKERKKENTKRQRQKGAASGRPGARPRLMHTCVMEDNVGGIVGENCFGCCLLESPPMGRMRGLSGTLRRGEALRGA